LHPKVLGLFVDLLFFKLQNQRQNLVLEANELNAIAQVIPILDPALLVLKLVKEILVLNVRLLQELEFVCHQLFDTDSYHGSLLQLF
jgi:hypothetical protein